MSASKLDSDLVSIEAAPGPSSQTGTARPAFKSTPIPPEHSARVNAHATRQGAVVGTLVGFKDEGMTPLVLFPGQSGPAAVPAETIVDVHGSHIGRRILLAFEDSDPLRPIILGILRGPGMWPLSEQPGQVQVEADGERLIVTAREQLVLRCGKASIILTRAGKIILKGEYLASRASGMHRISGGSVQIN